MVSQPIYDNTIDPRLLPYIEEGNNIGKLAQQQYDESGKMANQYYSNYMDIMKRLMEREDKLGSGNPFIDMLDGYINMRKSSNPNYQWQGLFGMLKKDTRDANNNRIIRYPFEERK